MTGKSNDLIGGMSPEKDKFSYAAYFDGACKAICSADPKFIKVSSQHVKRWEKAGAEVRLIPSKQACEDMGKWLESRKPQGELL